MDNYRFERSDVANREEELYRLVDGKLKGRSAGWSLGTSVLYLTVHGHTTV